MIANLDRDELSVVVGELLPAGYKESVSDEKMRSATYSALFDPNVHDSIDTAPTTGILVKQLNHDKCCLFLLHGRQDGIYRKYLLPSGTEVERRVVFYREWTDKIRCTQEKDRKAAFNSGVCEFTKGITPEALHQLARDLRDGALCDMPIDESLYRAFITLFCSEYTAGRTEGDEALHDAIQTAYRLASASVGQPLDTQEPRMNGSSRVIPSDLLYHIIRLRENHLRGVKELWTAERDAAMEFGGKMTEIVSPKKLIQDISSAMDIDHCREIAVKLFQMAFLRQYHFARSVVTQCEPELKLLKALWQSLPVKNDADDSEGEAEDDEDEEVEDGDEAMEDASEMDEDA
ncbi:hypothetical protein LCI18_008766 [Fusarium solani-melongenae]|uniref:Uncharacterized protein n=1 Tax=Fusarium solani subsp. cucurbitae TaxID=2747967 RepID=A0ACD3Z9M0_FUSSC|nr:hypothetical protein LCI18_008766 [Fusarium solani-melongenae]